VRELDLMIRPAPVPRGNGCQPKMAAGYSGGRTISQKEIMMPANSSVRLFHYTNHIRWKMILSDKVIETATLFVPVGQKPVVWFSFRQDWEPTASPGRVENGKVRRETFAEMVESGLIPYRIEVSPEIAPLNWRAWRKLSGVKSKMVKGLEETAIRWGANVNDWRMTFDAVKSGDWLAVESYSNGAWRPITPRRPIVAKMPSGKLRLVWADPEAEIMFKINGKAECCRIKVGSEEEFEKLQRELTKRIEGQLEGS
jgi:hypothetical protein